MRGNIDQGLERSPHVRPPISDPSSQTPHLRSGFGTFSPSQAPHFKPPISDSPSQAPISSHHLRPSTSDPPSQTPPSQAPSPPPQTPTSDPPPQTPRFSCETTISGPEHDTYNLRPHAFRVRLQYQAPTMSVITFFVQDYNIRLRTWHLQSQTPRFSCATTTMIRNPRTFAKDSFFGQSLSRAHLWTDIPAAWRGLFIWFSRGQTWNFISKFQSTTCIYVE